MGADAISALVNNLVSVAQAIGSLATAAIGLYVAWKQLQLHAKVDALTPPK